VKPGLDMQTSPVPGQPGYFIEKYAFDAESTPGRVAPLDLYSTEDHGHHLHKVEAGR